MIAFSLREFRNYNDLCLVVLHSLKENAQEAKTKLEAAGGKVELK